MPRKVQLHRQLKHPRFAVIGISAEDRDTVAAYHKKSDARYPISLLDPKGMMQKFFPGRSIPVTILVDGWGWVLGLKQGGAPWNAPPIQKLMRFLLSIAPSKDALREKAPAPLVQFEASRKVKANTTFALTFALRWNGESDKYTRVSFRFPKDNEIKLLGIQTSSIESNKQGNHRIYKVRMRITRTGSFDLDPILLNYWLKDYDGHFQKKIGKLQIIATSGSLISPTKRLPTWTLVTLSAAGLLLLLLLILAAKSKRPTTPTQNAETTQTQQLEDLITQTNEALQQGDHPRALTSLRKLLSALKADEEEASVQQLEDKVRYGGLDVPKDALLQHLNTTQSLLTQAHPSLPQSLDIPS